jgi:hypothetical protein
LYLMLFPTLEMNTSLCSSSVDLRTSWINLLTVVILDLMKEKLAR